MTQSLDPDADRIFSEDELITALRKKAARLVREISEIVGQELSVVMMPDQPASHWPDEARALFDEYKAVEDEHARRNMRRNSAQLSRFLRAINGEEEKTQAMSDWWANRY